MLSSMLAAFEKVTVKSVSHITGGGFYENIPRSLPEGCGVKIEKAAIKTPEIFDIIASAGRIPERDMFNTFNMGVGLCLTVGKDEADRALEILRINGEAAYILGEITASGEIEIC
jgi:phosphoribosylformylglycinamidine cyclo-ligase